MRHHGCSWKVIGNPAKCVRLLKSVRGNNNCRNGDEQIKFKKNEEMTHGPPADIERRYFQQLRCIATSGQSRPQNGRRWGHRGQSWLRPGLATHHGPLGSRGGGGDGGGARV